MTTAQQIHKDFNQALDTSIIKVKELPVFQSKTNELLEIGAISSSTLQKERLKSEQLKSVKEYNTSVSKLLEYEAKYPQYRIIDYSSIIKLCAKYKLMISSLSNYKEMIPQKNIDEIMEYGKNMPIAYHSGSIKRKLFSESPSTFLIVAPFDYFKEGKKIGNFVVPVKSFKFSFNFRFSVPTPDPIVLYELPISGNKKYFHIVSAWELEAEDELVTKQITYENSVQ
jgi:hypothetical protein